MDAKGVLEFAKKHGAKILDLRFIDVPGLWQHVSYPIGELEENSFKEGFGFDASSIRGWASIHESDMLLMPDPSTAFMDPFRDAPTLVMIGDAYDPPSKRPYSREDRKSTRLNSSHLVISYAVFCWKKKNASSFSLYATKYAEAYAPKYADHFDAHYAPLYARQYAKMYSRQYNIFFFNDTATPEIYTLSLHDAPSDP